MAVAAATVLLCSYGGKPLPFPLLSDDNRFWDENMQI